MYMDKIMSGIHDGRLRIEVHNNDQKDFLVNFLIERLREMTGIDFANGFTCDWSGYPYVGAVNEDRDYYVAGWAYVDDKYDLIDYADFMTAYHGEFTPLVLDVDIEMLI